MDKTKKESRDAFVKKALADPQARAAISEFVRRNPDAGPLIKSNQEHIESLERIIERQEARIERLNRKVSRLETENDWLKRELESGRGGKGNKQ